MFDQAEEIDPFEMLFGGMADMPTSNAPNIN